MVPGASAERCISSISILFKCWESLPGVIRGYRYIQHWESSLHSENPSAQLHCELFSSSSFLLRRCVQFITYMSRELGKGVGQSEGSKVLRTGNLQLISVKELQWV